MKRALSLSAGLVLILILTGLAGGSQAAPPMQPPRPPISPGQELDGIPFLDSGSTEPQAPGVATLPNLIPSSKIVFQSYRDGNWEIYLADGDGSHQRRLTHHDDSDIHARLNRGSSRIVFTSNRTGNYEIYTMNTDGSELTQLTFDVSDDVQPYWSPDGTKIAFQTYRHGNPEIYVINADGSDQTRLTSNDLYDGEPAWSPDGTQIAFVAYRSEGYRIYVMDADGRPKTRLAGQRNCENPVWSPDGSQIAYDSDGDGDNWQELWLMNADGTNQREIFDPGGTRQDAWARSWSPDGKYVAFTRISFIKWEGNWYWTQAYLSAWDLVENNATRLSDWNTDWRPDWQMFDRSAPVSSVHPLPSLSPGPFTVHWSGTDVGPSGLESYDIQIRDGAAGTWANWLVKTKDASASYPGVGGHAYRFRSRARDCAGNIEPWPLTRDAATVVESWPPTTFVRGLPAYARNGDPIHWGGRDPGGSGIQSYDVQYRDVTIGGDWVNWQTGVIETSAAFSGTPGHTYHFRSQGTDKAQNAEGWPTGEGDTHTTLYTWRVAGVVRDNTDTPVSGAIVTTTPEALAVISSNIDGAYAAYVADDASTYTAAWGKTGYAGLPVTSFDASADAALGVFLSPSDNVVTNWGFELGDTGWEVGGETSPVFTNAVAHTGDQSVMLGQLAKLSSAVNVSNRGANNYSSPAIAVESGGTAHVMWADDESGNWEIVHASSQNGEWSSPIEISNGLEGSNLPAIVLDSSDTLHAVWREGGSSAYLVYAVKAKGLNWTTPEEIPGAFGQSTTVGVDGEDTLHVVWDDTEIMHASKTKHGSWSSFVAISDSGSDNVYLPSLAVDPVGTIHVLWVQYAYSATQIFHSSKPRGGAWSTPVNLSGSTSLASYPDITIDSEGTLHAVWQDSALTSPGIVYTSKSNSGSWTAALTVANGQSDCPTIAALDSTLHLAWHTLDDYNYRIFYTWKKSDSTWNPPIDLSSDIFYSTFPAIASVGETIPHLVWESPHGIYYRGPALAEQTGDSTISQIVTIPITTQTPTLSFLYQLYDTHPDNGTWLCAQVDDGIAPTVLLSTTTNVRDWTHSWHDLTPWAGQAITLSFSVHLTAGQSLAWAYLDEVTVGSTYPDPWVRKSAWPLATLPGEEAVFTIKYGNRGGAAASGVQITDTLPTELSFVEASPPPISTTPTLVWDVGDLPAKSAESTIVVTASVAPQVPMWSYLTNTVSIGTASPELETLNNIAQVTIFVGYRFHLPLVSRE